MVEFQKYIFKKVILSKVILFIFHQKTGSSGFMIQTEKLKVTSHWGILVEQIFPLFFPPPP